MERVGEILSLQQYREGRRQEAMREPQKPRPSADELLARYQRHKEQQRKPKGAPQIVEGEILHAEVAPFSPIVPAQPIQKRESLAKGHHQMHTPALPPSSCQAPVCPICKGAGYVRADVPFGHPQFGKPLACQCKQAKKNDERRQRLREQSQIDQLEAFRESSFSTFQLWLPGVQEAYEAALQFAQDPQGWLVLEGSNGCGKTHLAVAIAKRCLDEGLITLFAVVPDLLDYLRSTFSPKTEECYDEAFLKMREADLLVLDDLGAESNTSWAQEKLFQLLNYRYNARLATVLTTNKVGFVGIETRIRSRLSDRRLVRVVTMGEVQDFRAYAEPAERENP